MPDIGAGTQMVLLFFLLIFLRIPVAFALGLSSLYAMWQIGFGLELAGDVIATGTPAGVGFGYDPPKYLVPGDTVVVSASGLGELRNPVA